MLHFSLPSKLLLLLCLVLLAACSHTPLSQKDSKIKQSTDSQAQDAEDKSDVAKQLIDEQGVAIDPMQAKINGLPLELIKGYDQINGYLKSKQLEQAKQLLMQLQEQFKDFSGPSYRLARLYLQQENFQQALDWINQSVAINPQNYYALNLQGVLYRETGQFVQAKQAYLKALNVYADHPQTHLNLAILADIYLYDFDLALKHYQLYLSKTQQQDEKISGWIADLQRRMAKS